MPHNSSQWVNHTIDGGWATDYANTLYASPQNGSISIPWLTKCENVRFYRDGSFGKYPGLLQVTASPILSPRSSTGLIESTLIRNLFDYVRMGATLTGTRVHCAVVGSYLYSFGFNTRTLIGDVFASATYPTHLTTFNDLLIVGSSGGTPRSWDQTTFQNLAGTPPAFGFSTSHAGRHWAAGVPSLPSRLYYSAAGNPEDWVGAGSGSIDIDPGDGDAIVGLLSWKRELWVFKGPNRLSIHRITGASPSDFARVPFTYGISAAGPMSIFPVGDDFAFWSPRGSCHTLSTTANYGDYIQSYVNFPVLSWFRNGNNISGNDLAINWQSVTDTSQNLSYCIFNNYVAGTPKAIILDWQFRSETNPYPRFIRLRLQNITAIALGASSTNSDQLVPFFGTEDGKIYEENLPSDASFSNGDGLAFPYKIETPSLSYGPTVYKKTIAGVSIDIVSNYNARNLITGNLEFSYGGREAAAQTLEFSNSGGVGLGTFVLGTDQLGSIGSIENYSEAVSGESRAFSYAMTENTAAVASAGVDARVKQFGILITPSGESLEN